MRRLIVPALLLSATLPAQQQAGSAPAIQYPTTRKVDTVAN
jgi:hypothetical protein